MSQPKLMQGPSLPSPSRRRLLVALLLVLLPLPGCWRGGGPDVVIYTSVDMEISQPIVDQFMVESGMRAMCRSEFDSAATTTSTSLADRIVLERDQPSCNVFWSNEVLETLRLAKLGLIEPHEVASADDIPSMYRSPRKLWYGFAARGRVLLVNIDRLHEGDRPDSIEDLADPRWHGRGGIARPLSGTTATHAACLFAAWGHERAVRFFDAVRLNARIMDSNKQVAEAVAAGELDFGLTDTDDAMAELEKGEPVTIVYPDQQPESCGTLFIPNTVALVRGAPRPEAGRQLMDYLLTPEVEIALAKGPSAQIPLRPGLAYLSRAETPSGIRPMQVDFQAASDQWEEAYRYLRETFAAD